MYQTNNKSIVFYKYDFSRNRYWLVGDFEDLLWEVYEQAMKSLRTYHNLNEFGKDLNYTGNDQGWTYWPNSEYVKIDKTYLYFDENDRIIDLRNYINLALKRYHGYKEKPKKEKKKVNYRYRYDPVPGYGGWHKGRHGRGTSSGLSRIRKYASDPEYGCYMRKKAITTYASGSERFKTHESWKKQKKRKQWM